MLFSEVYSCYFNAVAEILKVAVNGKLSRKKLAAIIQEKAFGESFLMIQKALESEEWPLLTDDLETPLQHVPTQPLTLIQKRWLKSLMLDSRVHLFEPRMEGLEEIEPLYEPSMFVYFDRYEDGDPYDDEKYIHNFRTVLQALRDGVGLSVKYIGRTGLQHEICGILEGFEYSSKDDKFRLKLVPTEGKYREVMEINMARVICCEPKKIDFTKSEIIEYKRKESVVLELSDERNALSRAMLHFSYLEKETEQLNEKHYRITIYYDKNDETEILIQILGFGPMVRVIAPENFRDKIKERINRQMKFF